MANELSPDAYETLIGQTVDLVTVLSKSGDIQYESPSIQEILGYEPEELVGEQVFEYIHPEDREQTVETFETVVNSDEGYTTGTVEFRFKHNDGSWVWMEGKGGNHESDEINGYVISSRDITARKEYEQSLKNERDKLDKFAKFLSHDIRNPLLVARGRIDILKNETGVGTEHLDVIDDSIRRLEDLLETMQTLVHDDDSEMDIQQVNVNETIPNCVKTLGTDIHNVNIETDQVIRADESEFKLILENLLRNAIEHNSEDVTVTVGPLSDGFYVSDTGSGIPEEVITNIRDTGFSTKSDGTGLGLSIVTEVVDNHDWTLNITHNESGGARFEITGVSVSQTSSKVEL